jgi:hypothetical protein
MDQEVGSNGWSMHICGSIGYEFGVELLTSETLDFKDVTCMSLASLCKIIVVSMVCLDSISMCVTCLGS